MTHSLSARAVAASLVFAAGIAAGVWMSASTQQATNLLAPAGAQDTARDAAPPAEAFVAKSPRTAMIARVSPAVVSVGAVKRTVLVDPMAQFFDPFLRNPRSSQTIQQRTPYMGSGFLVDREGHVLTNFHVIDGADSVFVTLPTGREVAAKVLDADRFIDVALLRLDLENVPPKELPDPLEFGDSDKLQIGEDVMAFGNPFGNLIEDPRPTVTLGVVSALHRTFRPDQQNLRVYQDMIQTDAAINPGNSGGPLVDADGRAVGINTFIFSQSGGSIGLGFAIPINRARAFVDEVLTYGKVRPLALDFSVLTLRTPRVQGVLINTREDNGVAKGAGLEIGDVITAVGGRRVMSREEFLLTLASRQVGDTLRFTVWRQGDLREVDYTIAAVQEDKAPEPTPTPAGGGRRSVLW